MLNIQSDSAIIRTEDVLALIKKTDQVAALDNLREHQSEKSARENVS